MERAIIFLSIFIFNACTVDKNESETIRNFDANQFPQKWELVAMSGMIANVPPTEGEEMEWQEYYLLQGDGTFTKSRERSNHITEATGNYKIVQLTDGQYLELTYGSDNELIGNCSIEPKEFLRFEPENTLIGTWQACDGLGLSYERTE